MIATLREAEKALAEGIADYEADVGHEAGDEAWFDLVVATAFTILSEGDTTLARQFCRTQVGYVPDDLKPYLDQNDGLH